MEICIFGAGKFVGSSPSEKSFSQHYSGIIPVNVSPVDTSDPSFWDALHITYRAELRRQFKTNNPDSELHELQELSFNPLNI